jgi:hypothetical protein
LRLASAEAPEELLAVFRAEAARLGIARGPGLRICDQVESPALVGFLKPAVLVPRWLVEASDPARVRWILAHELMHWKLKDTVGLLVRRMAEALLWFHPAVWWAGGRWEEAMERACDRALIQGETDARDYAGQLYQVLQGLVERRSRVRVGAGLFATRTQIGRRIAALLTHPLSAPSRLSPSALTLLVLLALAALSFGVGINQAVPEDEKEKTVAGKNPGDLLISAESGTQTPSPSLNAPGKESPPGTDREKRVRISDLAWQQSDSYTTPSFEAFFPDNVEGGKALDALWLSQDKDSRADGEIFETVRNGLRRTTKHRTLILAWVGNRYIWGKSPQHPYAIETMYHAADFSGERADPYGTRHYAVYFGLSVVQPKTPAILRTLADLCMRVDDPNDLGRVAWGAKSQQGELIGYLRRYLESSDESTRAKAEVCRRIFLGELEAFEWAREQARGKAKQEHASELPGIRAVLSKGNSAERTSALQLILKDRISLIMDDSFVGAFAACAEDSSETVRTQIAVIVGGKWIWSAQSQNAEAIELMLRLSEDGSREVRYNAVYYGLSTIQQKSEKVIRRLLEMAFEDREPNLYGRIAWGLRADRERVAAILDEYAKGTNLSIAKHAREIYKDMTGRDYREKAVAGKNPGDQPIGVGVGAMAVASKAQTPPPPLGLQEKESPPGPEQQKLAELPDPLDRRLLERIPKRYESKRPVVEALLDLQEKEKRPNALLYYMVAGFMQPDHRNMPLIGDVMRDGWNENAAPLKPFIESWQPAFRVIRKGVALDYAKGVVSRRPDQEVPDFLTAQRAAKALCVEGRYFESLGKNREALENYLAVLTMGRDYLSPDNGQISSHIGISVTSIGTGQIRALVAAGKLAPADLERCRTRLDALEKPYPSSEGVIRTEGLRKRGITDRIRKDANAEGLIAEFRPSPKDARSASKEQIREIMAKKTSVIRSLQFTFTKTILPAEGTKFEKEDDRCLYRIKSDRIFSSSNYKMYAERRDNKDQVIYCMSFDGKENYKLLPASNIPGRPGKDQLIVSKAGDFPTATGFFIAPRALYDAVYNVFYLDDMLQDETTKMDERNGLLIVSKSEGVFEGKAYLDPSREYAMVKSELIREGRPYVMTDISEFHELQVQGHRVSMPAKARTCVYNFEKPYQHTYDEEFVIEKIDVNEEYPEESFKLQPTGKGAFSLYDMTLQKGFVLSPDDAAEMRPDFWDADTRWHTAKAGLRLARVATGLEMYKLEHGRYPGSLDALTPAQLGTEPPIDPFSGKALLYRLDGDRYALWSIGPDSADNAAETIYDPTNGTTSQGDIILRR